MSEPIFASAAPAYYEKSISVIPLLPKSKKAFSNDWSQWHDRRIPSELQKLWIENHAYGNIGLVLGKQSGIVVVDVDTDNEAVKKAIESILPASPWVRVGKKGYAVAYRYSGERTRRIDDINGVRLVDVLSSGTQIVLPPSIHPDTNRPYVSNVDLVSVYEELPPLPEGFIELLEAALSTVTKLKRAGKFNSSLKISKGSRDSSMVEYAGQLVWNIFRGELSLKRAIDNMMGWYHGNVADDPNDPLDINKGVNKIVSYLLEDIHEKGKVLPVGWDEGLTEEQKKELGITLSEEHRQWDYQEAMAYLDKMFKEHEGANNPQRLSAIETTLKKIHMSAQSLNSLEIDRILQFIARNSGAGIPKSAYARRLKEISTGEQIRGTNHTEIAQATIREFERIMGEIRYDFGEFWRWQGSHWEPVDNGDIERIIQLEFGEMDAAKRYSDVRGIRQAMINLVKPKIQTLEIEGVNFSNGFLTKELQLLEHNPAYGMTYTLPYRYDPSKAHECTQFQQMLDTSWRGCPDLADKKRLLQEAMSCTIFGLATKLQAVFCLKGAGQSGKSQLLTIVSELVPETARSSVPPERWRDRFVPAELHGKLLNVCGELPDKKKLDGKSFKEITAGDEITAERKYSSPFKYRPTAAHWFATNRLPRSDDSTDGFNRRWLFLEFPRKVPDSEKILDLGNKILSEEIEAIVAWAIEAFPDLLKRGHFTTPESHFRLKNQMALQNSTVRQFYVKGLYFDKMDPEKLIEERELHKKYYGMVVQALRDTPISCQNFLTEFEDLNNELNLFPRIMKDEKGYYQGVGIRSLSEIERGD